MRESDPLRITITAPAGITGTALAEQLRQRNVECEYADPESLVLMATPENKLGDLLMLLRALGENTAPPAQQAHLPLARGERVRTVREALLAPHETIPADASLGRICAAPTVSCPPAIPVAVSGERIGPEALELFRHYGVETVDVVKE